MTMHEQLNVAEMDTTNSLGGLTPDEVDALFAPVVRATKPCDLCDHTPEGEVCAGCDGGGEVPA